MLHDERMSIMHGGSGGGVSKIYDVAVRVTKGKK